MAELLETKNKVFAGIYKLGEDGLEVRRQEFLKMFNDPKVFQDEYYLLALLVKEFSRIEISNNFIKNFMISNRPSLEKSENITLSKYQIDGESDSYSEFMQSCLALHNDLQKIVFTKNEFLEGLEIYKMNYMTEQSITVLEESTRILTEGAKHRGKNLVGYDDMRAYLKSSFQSLDSLTDQKERKGIITYGINDIDDAENEANKVEKISPYGIPSLDAHLGGVFQGEMVSLLAPAKGGKSRMATYILHTALVNGVNICMWSIENGYKGWEALLRARHFNYYYNEMSGNTDLNKAVILTDDRIRKNDMDKELREKELASWTDLKGNSSYGKITTIDEDFNIETFLEIIDSAVKMNDVKLICIDYLQLVQGSGRASKNERVAEAYQKTLQYLKGHKIAGIFPGQFKQTATGNLSRTDAADMVNLELRDAAGESYEVIKTPDVNLALYATVEELRQQKMHILSIPSRNHKPFDPIEINCKLGCCTFTEITKKS